MKSRFEATWIRHYAVILFLALGLTACTSVTYKPNGSDGSAKPSGYPIPHYTERQDVPRPCEVIGTVSANPGKFTLFGGTAEKEWKQVMKVAYEKGADAIKINSYEKPGFANPNFRLKVDLLRYSSAWETITNANERLLARLQANQKLDPIEGVWSSRGFYPHVIGIMQDKSKPGRDFVGFIINASNPAWSAGSKKMDIRRGVAPGSYVLTYFLDDFDHCEARIRLDQDRKITFMIQGEETQTVIEYTKN